MGNYMRTMIYLKEREDAEQTAGYLRLERKGGYLLFSLALTGTVMPEGCPVYAVYERDGPGAQPMYRLGCMDGGGSSCEGRILLSRLPLRGAEERIFGALVGTEDRYLAGTADRQHGLPAWSNVRLAGERPGNRERDARTGSQASGGTGTAAADLQAAEESGSPRDPHGVHEFFEDDEMVWCERIDPMQVSHFDMEEWYLAANSFLLQGYYNYHHLIYASDGEKTYLGVPGQYRRRELYMAKRFGFPHFKGKQDKPARTGDPGYWLREIKKDVQR